MQPVTDLLGLVGVKLAAGFTQAQAPAIPLWEVLVVFLGAAALCLPSAWKYSSFLTILVHELGHAVAAISVGRFVSGIHLHSDHYAITYSYGSRRMGPAMWKIFWGYPVPSVVGGALVWASLAGWSQLALTIGGLVVLLSLLAMRNRLSVLVALVCAAVPLAFVWVGDPRIGAHAALALGVVLLVGALRSFGEVLTIHARDHDDLGDSDAQHLALETGVPAGAWLTLLGAAIAGSWYATLIAVVPLLHVN